MTERLSTHTHITHETLLYKIIYYSNLYKDHMRETISVPTVQMRNRSRGRLSKLVQIYITGKWIWPEVKF